MTTPAPRLGADVLDELDRRLAPADAELAARYPGDPGTRQPVHTVYVPADQLTPGLTADWGGRALAALADHAPTAAALAVATGLEETLVAQVLPGVLAKLEAEPVEDLRLDFEDGYGPRPGEREDADAAAAALTLAGGLAGAAPPPCSGLRIRSLEAATRRRGLRTLDLFLGALLDGTELPAGFVVTLPKVTDVRQVEAWPWSASGSRRPTGWPRGGGGSRSRSRPRSRSWPPTGRPPWPGWSRRPAAAARACTTAPTTTAPPSASPPPTRAWSTRRPTTPRRSCRWRRPGPACGCRTGRPTCSPVGGTEAVHAALWLHARLVRRSLERGYWQGWDLHPAQLPTRYLATYAFFREGLPAAAARLRAYAERTAGGVLDEPATAQALAGFLARGLDCGALTEAEVTGHTGLDRAAVDQFARRSGRD